MKVDQSVSRAGTFHYISLPPLAGWAPFHLHQRQATVFPRLELKHRRHFAKPEHSGLEQSKVDQSRADRVDRSRVGLSSWRWDLPEGCLA